MNLEAEEAVEAEDDFVTIQVSLNNISECASNLQNLSTHVSEQYQSLRDKTP